jgi:hypothetical protein
MIVLIPAITFKSQVVKIGKAKLGASYPGTRTGIPAVSGPGCACMWALSNTGCEIGERSRWPNKAALSPSHLKPNENN